MTGYNEAFIIDRKKKDELISADPKSAEIIRPILRGRDIKRYGFDFAEQYIIATFPSKNYNIDDYPAVKEYLLSFGIERLEQSGKQYTINGKIVKSRKKTNNKWFETQDSISYWDDFSKQKIVWKRIGSILRFCYDESGMFCLDSTCFATGDKLKFLTLLLNSPLGRYLLKDSPKTGTGDLLISVQALEPLLIPPITDLIINSFDQEYDTLTKMCFDDKIDYERKIYIQLCKLYCFDEAEIKYISTF